MLITILEDINVADAHIESEARPKRKRRLNELGEGYVNSMREKNRNSLLAGSYGLSHYGSDYDSDTSEATEGEEEELLLEKDENEDNEDDMCVDVNSLEEYWRQRTTAFYKLLRYKCNLLVCPCCAEEKAESTFHKKPIFYCESLPVNHFQDSLIKYGDNKIFVDINTQRLFEPIVREGLDPTLLQSYFLVPFLTVIIIY